MEAGATPSSVGIIWKNVKDPVMVVLCHPEWDNYFAYATAKGRVVVQNLAESRAPATSCGQHQTVVYELRWRKMKFDANVRNNFFQDKF